MRRGVGISILPLAVAAIVPPLLVWLGWNGPDPVFLPPPGTSVAIEGGLVLNVTEQGEGAPIVLVHGLPSSAADWGAVPQQLAALGHRVVAYDRTGFGYSSRPPDASRRSSSTAPTTAMCHSHRASTSTGRSRARSS